MFLTKYNPPEKRRSFATDGIELRLTEAAVMLAYALHVLEQDGSSGSVSIHPDGEHAKIFEIVPFLERRGFRLAERIGTTNYGGSYVRGAETLIVRPTSGYGDVTGEVNGRRSS